MEEYSSRGFACVLFLTEGLLEGHLVLSEVRIVIVRTTVTVNNSLVSNPEEELLRKSSPLLPCISPCLGLNLWQSCVYFALHPTLLNFFLATESQSYDLKVTDDNWNLRCALSCAYFIYSYKNYRE